MTVHDFLIDVPPEPTRLLLSWRPPLYVIDRSHWVVGELVKQADGAVFSYLAGEKFRELNLKRTYDQLRAAGYRGYPAFGMASKAPSSFQDGVLAAFMRRMPSQTRSDYPSYLAHHFLRGSSRPSPFTLLSITGARLPSDGFSLVDPFDPEAQSLDAVIEIVGVRHYKKFNSVEIGATLTLLPDPTNVFDDYAIKILFDGEIIGFVGRLQAHSIRFWLMSGKQIDCWMVRRNGTKDSPRAFGFLRLRPPSLANAA